MKEIQERLEIFLTMKSLTDGHGYALKVHPFRVIILKDDNPYLLIEDNQNHYNPISRYKMDIIDQGARLYIWNKYKYSYEVTGEKIDEIMIFIEKYMMEA